MMKLVFAAILLDLFTDLGILSWMAISKQRPSVATTNPSLRRRVLPEKEQVTRSAFDYSASPSAAATSTCALINVLVNETATSEEEQTWLQKSNIPRRVAKYQNDGYDNVFVCGSGCGISESEPSSAHRFMGCTLVDASGVFANTGVLGWTSKTEDSTDPVEETLSDMIHASIEQTMASLPSSIQGIALLDSCQQFDKELVFATTENELGTILQENGIKDEVEDFGYRFDVISQWGNTIAIPVSI